MVREDLLEEVIYKSRSQIEKMQLYGGLPGKRQAGMMARVRENLGAVKEQRGGQCD